MALRLLEFTLPNEELAGVPALLEDTPVLHLAVSGAESGPGLVRILLEAGQTEAVTDVLSQHFAGRDDFRLVLLPVEATVPAVEPPSEAGSPDGSGDMSKPTSPDRISREELYQDLTQASRLTPVYLVMVTLSTVVAAVGLTRGDVAIIIGAMVIAPLLGPNMALSLACTLGDLQLARRSIRAGGAGLAAAAVFALILGTLLEVDPLAPELAARTRPEFADILLALAAGAAGSLAFTGGVPAVVVGVMVAVALLPPLVVAGLLAGSGHWMPALGALVLMLTNVTCVNLSAVATFLLQKVRPRTWWEEDLAKKATRVAVATWIGMLVILLVLMLLLGAGAV